MARRPQGPPAFATAPRGNSRWLIGALALALIAATATAVWALTRPADSGGVDPQTADPTTTSSAVPVDNGPADGCLGGLDPTTAMLAAHAEADLSAAGAAAFSATFLRWLFQMPRPVDDLTTTAQEVTTTEVQANIAEMATSLQAASADSGSVIRGTTVGQRYEVVRHDAEGAVVASTIRFVDEAGLREPSETLLFVKLVASEGRWLADVAPSSEERVDLGLPGGADEELQSYRDYLFAQGTPYEGAC